MEQALAQCNQARTQRAGATLKHPLAALVLGATLGGFDRNGRKPQRGKIVRAGAHIDLPNVARQFKCVRDQLAGRKGRQFEGPLIEVHVGMQAAALLELRHEPPFRLQPVQRPRLGRKEPESVEMRAAHRKGFDDPGQRLGRKAQRHLAMTHVARLLAVNHGPFMQSMTAKERRPALQAEEELPEPPHKDQPRAREEGLGQRPTVLVQQDPIGARMPPLQRRGPKRIILKQEIPHRMLLSARGAFAMGPGPDPHPLPVSALTRPPFGGGQDGSGRLRDQAAHF